MSKYKVGDKFILEVGESYTTEMPFGNEEGSPITLYKAKGFNSLVFDDYGLDKLEKYNEVKEKLELIDELKQAEYNRGLQDAWELAKKLWLPSNYGGIPHTEILKIFKCDYYVIAENYTPHEAFAKLEAYEKEQEQIKVGDVVEYNGIDGLFIVTGRDNTFAYILDGKGNVEEVALETLTRTGKHFDVASMLLEIGE